MAEKTNKIKKEDVFRDCVTKVRGRELDLWSRMWNSADVDGCLNSCAGGKGVVRNSAGWEWGTKLRSRYRDF